ncbi:MAG: hypothetical protein KAQ83_02890 [Nanoarchaeota archaeon]|nr:hypothetical protein [Nanoarchaeota archaeon]
MGNKEYADFLAEVMEIAEQHDESLNIPGIERNIEALEDRLLVVEGKRVDMMPRQGSLMGEVEKKKYHELSDLTNDYKNAISELWGAFKAIGITNDAFVGKNSIPIGIDLMLRKAVDELSQYELDNVASDYVSSLAKTDLRESRLTGDTEYLINQALTIFTMVKSGLSEEIKDKYLETVGRIKHSVTERMNKNKPQEWHITDLRAGEDLYQTFLETGYVLDNTDSTRKYPKSLESGDLQSMAEHRAQYEKDFVTNKSQVSKTNDDSISNGEITFNEFPKSMIIVDENYTPTSILCPKGPIFLPLSVSQDFKDPECRNYPC